MFTGIVEELGEVLGTESGPSSARLTVRGPVVTADARHGDSIAVNGVCLTVTDQPAPDAFTADVMLETLERTTLGGLRLGDPVNLERAVPAGARLGGHVVQGHVDGVGRVVARTRGDRWETVRIEVPAALARYVAEKGSVAVDGTSLTVAAVHDDPAPSFSVGLIPTTLAATTLGRAAPGARVNLEVDVIAKYVERLLTAGAAS
ncbi:riboflavin synthase [Kineosporiaceae bacterium SCSIO 59966]|nr:riboflavin synthase [Kineosporiaceae bacterium SCSIO 59966]